MSPAVNYAGLQVQCLPMTSALSVFLPILCTSAAVASTSFVFAALQIRPCAFGLHTKRHFSRSHRRPNRHLSFDFYCFRFRSHSPEHRQTDTHSYDPNAHTCYQHVSKYLRHMQAKHVCAEAHHDYLCVCVVLVLVLVLVHIALTQPHPHDKPATLCVCVRQLV